MATKSLLTLPPELRHLLWTTIYSLYEPPRIIYRAPYGHSVSVTCQVSTQLPSTCHQLHAEVWPVIWENLTLHLTRDHHNTEHTYLYKPLPAYLQDKIQHVIWYMTTDQGFRSHSIPHRPLPLWLFPSLRSVTICYALGVDYASLPEQQLKIGELMDAGKDASDLRMKSHAEGAGISLDHKTFEERLEQWMWTIEEGYVVNIVCNAARVADVLSGDWTQNYQEKGKWMSAILDPDGLLEEDHKRQWNAADQEQEAHGNDDRIERSEEEIEECKEKRKEIEKLKEIARRAQVKIQLECMLTRKDPTLAPATTASVETDCHIILVANVRQGTVKLVEAREIGREEYRTNMALGLSAYHEEGS